MPDDLLRLLAELERFGLDNDARNSERPRRMLNITRDTGEFLAVLVRATAARHVLEIGTSNGYSTLWLADAARTTGGVVTTVERSADKVALAKINFERSGLGASIRQIYGDAGDALARAADASIDLLFLDSERAEYAGWWPQLGRVLRPNGLLVVDNAISHAGELAGFFALVRAETGWTSCLVPVGKGEFLAVGVACAPEAPSGWVVRWAPLIGRGRVLDVACGAGRHARWLAARGLDVVAVDRELRAIPGVRFVQADLEGRRPWPFPGERFAGVVVTNYLHRPLFPDLIAALAPGGLLIYETFMLGNERFGRPSNPQYLLRPGELFDAFGSLHVIAFEQGRVREPKAAMVQRLCAMSRA